MLIRSLISATNHKDRNKGWEGKKGGRNYLLPGEGGGTATLARGWEAEQGRVGAPVVGSGAGEGGVSIWTGEGVGPGVSTARRRRLARRRRDTPRRREVQP